MAQQIDTEELFALIRSDLVGSSASNVEKFFQSSQFIDCRGAGGFSKVLTSLLRNIEKRQAFSLLRLGDGEGNVLFWGTYRTLYPSISKICMARTWALMFGRHPGNFDFYQQIFSYIECAIENASYVGVPLTSNAALAIGKLRSEENGGDIRGNLGLLSVLDYLALHASFNTKTEILFPHCHVHNDLSLSIRSLIQASGNVSVITCYSGLLQRLHTLASVSHGLEILIPPQAVNLGKTPDLVHYPDAFFDVCGRLTEANCSEALFLVGAGLLGKFYCEMIRRCGGMAIDVGSLMDVWMGIGVRPYQSSDFVLRHRLSAS